MKKLFIALSAAVMAGVASANMVDWKYNASSSDKNAEVYLYVGSEAPTAFESLEKLVASSISTGKTVTEIYNSRKKTYTYTAEGSASSNWSDTDSFYVVLVAADGSGFYVNPTSVSVSGMVYEEGGYSPGSAGASGTSAHEYAAFSGGGSGGGEEPVTPEPTSGILLLVGGALLGLRRKRA